MNILRVGRYRLLQRLGEGTFSEVYVAEDTLLRRKVAIKLLRAQDGDERQTRHFEREARSASLLNHPNVLTVYDAGRDGDVHYIATELIDGETLRQRLDRGPLTLEETVHVALGVAAALVAAHEAWLVHRDIKPENIAIRRDGVVKLLDFGVSALSGDGDVTDPIRRPGALVGTLHYLSPEQVRGEPIIDSRSDLYALGVVLYEMLGHRVPFTGKSVMDVLAAIVEWDADPLPRFIPEALRQLVNRCLRKSIYERPQTAQEIVGLLTQMQIDRLVQQRQAQIA